MTLRKWIIPAVAVTAFGTSLAVSDDATVAEAVSLFRSVCMETFPDIDRAAEVLSETEFTEREVSESAQRAAELARRRVIRMSRAEDDMHSVLAEMRDPTGLTERVVYAQCAIGAAGGNISVFRDQIQASLAEEWPDAAVESQEQSPALALVTDDKKSEGLHVTRADITLKISVLQDAGASTDTPVLLLLENVSPLPDPAR